MRSRSKGQENWPPPLHRECAVLTLGLRIIGFENNLVYMPSPDVYWLALRRARGVGPRTCKLLIEKFGTPEKIFQLSSDEIAAAGCRATRRAVSPSFAISNRLRKNCASCRTSARLIKWTDPDYPPNLRQIADP